MNEKKKKDLYIREIKDGIVIDHIPAGKALVVLRILGITGDEGYKVLMLMNAESRKIGRKDIVKLENRKLTRDELNKISLIAPTATISIIEDYKVVEKYRVTIPDVIENVVKCSNPMCVTNSGEYIKPRFEVVEKHPIKLRCVYCKRFTTIEDIMKQF